MANVPEAMLQKGREADQNFDVEERLFRRFRGDHYCPGEKSEVGEEAIDLPDMSVGREKHGGKPEFLLVHRDRLRAKHPEWGVFQFKVRDIPESKSHHGAYYSFRPVHVPWQHDYFHSEIHCYDSRGRHLSAKDKELFPRDLALRWRRQLRFKIQVCIPPRRLDD